MDKMRADGELPVVLVRSDPRFPESAVAKIIDSRDGEVRHERLCVMTSSCDMHGRGRACQCSACDTGPR